MKEFKFIIGGQDYTATVVEEKKAGSLTVTVNGNTYSVEIPQTKVPAPKPIVQSAAASGGQAGGPKTVLSELPGTVIEVKVKDGDHVKKGDVLLVIEAMKMANDIVSEVDGTVQKVAVTVGQNVGLGDLLVDMVADFVAAEAPGLAPKPAPAAPAPVVAPAPAPKPAAGNNAVVAPLPGTVTKVLVKEGQQVGPNDTICLLEAMKMENTISAGTAGTVKKVLVKEGVQVQQGEALVELA